MSELKVTRIQKQDSSVVPFKPDKIEQAIYKALAATGAGGRELAAELAKQVVAKVEARFSQAILLWKMSKI